METFRQSIRKRTSTRFQGEDLINRVSMERYWLCSEVKTLSAKYRWEDLDCVSRWRSHRQSIDVRNLGVFRGEYHINKVSIYLDCVSRWKPYWQSIDVRTSAVFQDKTLSVEYWWENLNLLWDEDRIDRVSIGEPRLCFKVKTSSTEYQCEMSAMFQNQDIIDKVLIKRTSTRFWGEYPINRISVLGNQP